MNGVIKMKSEKDILDSFAISVTDHVSAILGYWDKDLVCRFANAAYSDWFGRKKEDMIDKITLKELLGPLYERTKPYIKEALKGNVQNFENEIPLPNGNTRYSMVSYFPDIADGRVKGFYVHVADITAIRILEMERARANEIISEQNKRLSNFANIVSHNLKSYSNNLALVIDLLVKADSEEKKNEMLTYLKGISKGFSDTVSHLNDIAKTQNGSKAKTEEINLHEYIKKSLEILSIQLKNIDAIVRNNVKEDVILLANSAYMESIILNLLTNAIKYRHLERTTVIEIDSDQDDDELMFRIKDNGLGINLEKHGKDLFGMYKTFHRNPEAHGVGLFITKNQVESMGGRIVVQSEVDKGTTFNIYFKIA